MTRAEFNGVGVTAAQQRAERTLRVHSMRAVREQLSAEVNAGIEIEVLSIGGSTAAENEQTREFENEVEWTGRYGRPTFTRTIDANRAPPSPPRPRRRRAVGLEPSGAWEWPGVAPDRA